MLSTKCFFIDQNTFPIDSHHTHGAIAREFRRRRTKRYPPRFTCVLKVIKSDIISQPLYFFLIRGSNLAFASSARAPTLALALALAPAWVARVPALAPGAPLRRGVVIRAFLEAENGTPPLASFSSRKLSLAGTQSSDCFLPNPENPHIILNELTRASWSSQQLFCRRKLDPTSVTGPAADAWSGGGAPGAWGGVPGWGSYDPWADRGAPPTPASPPNIASKLQCKGAFFPRHLKCKNPEIKRIYELTKLLTEFRAPDQNQ